MNGKARINLIDQCRKEGPEAFGMAELRSALAEAGIGCSEPGYAGRGEEAPTVLAGDARWPYIEKIARENGIRIPTGEESAVLSTIALHGKPALLVSGGGETGTMYSLLEMAQRVRSEGIGAFLRPRCYSEAPALAVRGVNRFIMGPLDDEWFLSDHFWDYFFARLAYSRINRFVFITGYDSAYMSPPYSYFVSVPGASSVRVKDLDAGRRGVNLARLRDIGRRCAEKGILFFFGIWQQLPFETGQGLLVEGLPKDEDALAEYCARGLREMLVQCPEIAGIHLRVNYEAGVGSQITAEDFWKSLIDQVAACGRPVKLDLRAKGLTDGMIDHALALGLDLSVPTKYWCEQTGLPHHLTRMRSEELCRLENLNHSRRYSYGNLLKRPRSYDMVYRLWNLGATNLFVWGDPDWTRRFCASMAVGDASGFEFSSPLSLKYGHYFLQKDPWSIFADPKHRSGRFEDERYWYQYELFGRIGYDPSAGWEIFGREFARRYGASAGAQFARAYAAASRIIPLVTASHMPVHPMEQYWPELSPGGALFQENQLNRHYKENTYGATVPSDPGLFYGIEEYRRERAAGRLPDKYTPLQAAAWLLAFAEEVKSAAEAAEASADLIRSPEYEAAAMDFKMLESLAVYHADKICAALALARYKEDGTQASYDLAWSFALAARTRWKKLADLGSALYRYPLEFGAGTSVGRTGHWKDMLAELDADLASLEAIKPGDGPKTAVDAEAELDRLRLGCAEARLGGTLHYRQKAQAGADFSVAYVPNPTEGRGTPTLRYRRTDQTEGAFKAVEMAWNGDRFEAVIEGAYLTEAFDLLFYLVRPRDGEAALMLPGLYNPEYALPYVLVPVGKGPASEAL